MALNCRNALMCVVLFIYLSEVVTGSFISDTLDFDLSLFVRHRRSYAEQHRRSKEAMLSIGNAVKSAAHGAKSTVFITDNCTVVVAQTGGTATLPCVVRKFSNGVVSWIRKQDYHLLTVGVATYNTDDRFMVEHVRHLQNWGLLIKHVQPSDAGLYECQVSTHPPTSIIVELKVTIYFLLVKSYLLD
ncbi:hypothetical protein HUJ04_004742 [Dendroctonus ponderosae]|nr:hypothetical protein HUJ04_004742 [Dendroctonus ponderosae]